MARPLPGRGFRQRRNPELPLNLALLKQAGILGVFWGEFVRREPQRNAAAVAHLLDGLRGDKLRPHISARYALEDTPRALQEMAARRVTGKVLITR